MSQNKKILWFSLGLNGVLIICAIMMVQALGGFRYLWFKINNRGASGTYQHRLEFLELMKINPTDIVFLGNSLIAECEWDELLQDERVKNRGISGDMINGVRRRLDGILQGNPLQLFVLIGTNDLFYSSANTVIQDYQLLLEDIQAKKRDTEILLMSLLPVNNMVRETGRDNEDIRNINARIKAFSEQFGYTYIDIHKVLKDDNGNLQAAFTEDGLHLNGQAYQKWKEAIKNLLKK